MKKLISVLGLLLLSSSSASAQSQLGAGGGVSPNLPVPPASAQGPTYNVINYGAKGDTQHVTDGVTAGAAKTVTSATAAWCNGGSIACPSGRTSDVGKFISCTSASGILMPATAKILSVTATVATTDTNDNGAGAGLRCIWYTQDDTAGFTTATTAATPASLQLSPDQGKTLGKLPGTVYCPEGGYAVSASIFTFTGAGSSIGPNFVGAGRNKCIIYPIPGSSFTYLFYFYNGIGAKISDFTIEGLLRSYGGAGQGAIVIDSSQQWDLSNVAITNYSTNSSAAGTLYVLNSSNGHIRNVFIQGAGTTNDYACSFNGSTSIVVDNITCSNHFQTLNIIGGGLRSIGGDNGPVFHGGIMDECNPTTPPNCTTISTNGGANFFGTSFMFGGANQAAVNIDATSRAYFSNVVCGIFGNSTVVGNCMSIASGGEADVSMSDLRGNDTNSTTGAAVTGPAGAKFIDIGGNKIRHSVSAVIADVTPAQYATLGFTGGIVPKATVTQNTCYAVTGNLLATAQNICTFLNDQNYQILNITAQSGGTTPANSACATPPIITFSDGTRTATLTMTTAKTQWSSAVDTATNIGQVFASGTTLTISIGANTCATPPVNVAVSYVLQSVLNP